MMDDDQSSRERAVTEPGQAGYRGADDRNGDPASASTQPQPAAAGRAASRQVTARPRRKRPRSFWRELPVLILIALVIALLIKTFVVQAFYIPSSSMENTLDIGDKVLVNKLVYHFRPIEAGDIVVFNGAGSWTSLPAPSKPSSDPLVRLYDATLVPAFRAVAGLFGTVPGQEDFIKRVIGVPGDHVACCNAQGDVTVNGVALHEQSYLYPGDAPSTKRFNVIVPPGRLWVMGDHRAVSFDSRGHMVGYPGHGTIPENMVIGRAFVIVWPPSRWRILPIPATFEQSGIDLPRSAAAGKGSAAAGKDSAAAALAAAAAGPGTRVAPAAPYLPVEAGFVGAVPLTWLQWRLRRRLRRRRPGRR
jgi:signal peptidase I